MAHFQTRLNRNSEEFARNREGMLTLVAQLREYEGRAAALSEKRRDRFHERGQLTPRERVAALLDPGMPFLELYNMANFEVEDPDPKTSVPGANSICGIGFVSGVRCMIMAHDSGIDAGAATATSVVKTVGCLTIANRQKLPVVQLVESAGANLVTYTVELWAHGGGMFFNLARLSAKGIPTITVLHGPSTAGGAYQPGMSDYVIGVKKNGMAALAGAALTYAATGEMADERELGGSEMHASVSGLVEYLADDDANGIAIAREVVAGLDWNSRLSRPLRQPFDEPLYSTDELAGLVPVDYRVPYDVRELVARIADASRFTGFKDRYGGSTVCLHASVMGHACGIIGNNGPIDPQGATKAAQFIQLCDQAGLPLVFLSNTTGYMVGTQTEQAGMIKHGSKMIQAVSNARVPKISLYVGASFGAGNYGMCGFAYEPDFLFAWPNAMTGVMGGEQAALTMDHVARVSARRRGLEPDEAALEKQKARITAHFDRQHTAFHTSGRGLDMGVIDPRDTRKVIGFTLATCAEGRARKLRPNAFGVARM